MPVLDNVHAGAYHIAQLRYQAERDTISRTVAPHGLVRQLVRKTLRQR